jgi:1,4-dihydroxy-2-naphthoyl-CoA hydrolase
MPFSGSLGIESVSGSASEVHGRLSWDAQKCTDSGAMHGGALMGLADPLGGLAAFLNLPRGAVGTTTIESKTNFFTAVRHGNVEAASAPVHVGRTTMVVDTHLRDADGRLVARVAQTQAVLFPRR